MHTFMTRERFYKAVTLISLLGQAQVALDHTETGLGFNLVPAHGHSTSTINNATLCNDGENRIGFEPAS